MKFASILVALTVPGAAWALSSKHLFNVTFDFGGLPGPVSDVYGGMQYGMVTSIALSSRTYGHDLGIEVLGGAIRGPEVEGTVSNGIAFARTTGTSDVYYTGTIGNDSFIASAHLVKNGPQEVQSLVSLKQRRHDTTSIPRQGADYAKLLTVSNGTYSYLNDVFIIGTTNVFNFTHFEGSFYEVTGPVIQSE
jgi:hypothetical protein